MKPPKNLSQQFAKRMESGQGLKMPGLPTAKEAGQEAAKVQKPAAVKPEQKIDPDALKQAQAGKGLLNADRGNEKKLQKMQNPDGDAGDAAAKLELYATLQGFIGLGLPVGPREEWQEYSSKPPKPDPDSWKKTSTRPEQGTPTEDMKGRESPWVAPQPKKEADAPSNVRKLNQRPGEGRQMSGQRRTGMDRTDRHGLNRSDFDLAA